VSAALWPCFAVSGAAALGLELLWMRSASLVAGATAATTATVLACYFGGLGGGAWLARRGAARPVVRYGRLELGVATGAIWSLGAFGMLARPEAQALLEPGGPAARAVAVAAAVVPATLCLGATLPALGQSLAAGGVGRRGGLLYAVNTLGGAAGIAAMGFGLPGLVGVTASYLTVAVASALAGGIAIVVAGRVEEVPRSAAPAGRPPARLRAVAAASGALGLGLEVLWTRLFAQVLHNSVYSFAAVSLVVLLALAAGAALAALLVRRTAPGALAAGALVAAAAATVGGLWAFVALTDGLSYFGMKSGLGEYVLRIVGLAAATAGPGALASGAVLPALWAAYGERDGAARPLGDLTAANTVGAVAGAVAAGFVVLPTVGLRTGFLLAAVAYVVLADVVAPAGSRVRPLAYVVLLVAALLDPARAPLTSLRAGETLRSMAEGAAGIVTVVDTGDDLQLRLDDYYVLGGSAAATNERRQGLVPLLLHPSPRRAAFIGMATGITASAGPALGVDETAVVEVVPEVAAAADASFGAWNAALLERPDVRLVVDDGRRWLAATSERFDVVVSDLFIPWHASAGSLYAREMFETARTRLAPGGLFCQWLPLYQLTREEFDAIARTFLAVFPDVSVWRNDFYPDRPVVALVGRVSPRPVDLGGIGERLKHLPEWARDPLLATSRGLAMLYVGDLASARDLVAPGPLNTDDRPLLEFLAPRLTRMSAAGDKDWFTEDELAAFGDALSSSPLVDLEPVDDRVAAARRAGLALFRYALAARRGDEADAARYEAEVRALAPDVVALGERGESVATLADARRTLGTLQSEQQRVARRLEAMERRLDRLGAARGDGP
jgi:spermidine synthase